MNAKRLLVGFAALVLSAAPVSAHDRIYDDQIPWGPEGTIGRGTDTPPGRSWRWDWRSGSWIRYGPAARRSAPVASEPPAAGPYRVNQFYEPGDGYRYPLYYDPATGSYLYYPVRP